ncbi:MAG: hypothetical protein HZA90_24645 [Verrucomicrobia bacterium]|nr:hypothetical protein [Verrucomicrobiota bacterium]
MDDAVEFGSRWYLILLNLLLFARGMDLLSTWLATPRLALEANPIARRLGWKWGLPFNVVVCAVFAAWPLPAVIISTTSVLVAARNFQSVWLMRTLGEEAYRQWMVERIHETQPVLYLGCLLAQVALFGTVGGGLMFFSRDWVPFGIGTGILAYAVAVLLFTLISLWRIRRESRSMDAN